MIRINRSNLFYAFSLLVVFRMDGLIYIFPYMKYIYGVLQAVVLLYSVYLMLRYRLSAFPQIFLLALFFVADFFITIANKGSFEQIVSMIISDFTICLVSYVGIKKNPKNFIRIADQIFLFLLFVNLVSMWLFPGGIGLTRSSNKIFLLTSDNALLKYLLVFCVVHNIANCYKRKKWWLNFFFYVICIVELWIGEAATSFFAFLVYGVGIIFIGIIPYTKFWMIEFASILLCNWFLLIFRQTEVFESLIAKLGKDMTFSGRTYIWDEALKLIPNSPFWGYGVTENTYYVIYKNTLMEAHNYILGLLLQGGLILLFLLAVQVIYLGQKNYGLTKQSAINYVIVGLIAYGVMFFVESPPTVPGFFLLIVLCGNLPELRITRKRIRCSYGR